MARRKTSRRSKAAKPAARTARPGGRPAPQVSPGRLPPASGGLTVLAEAPHSHIVCRVCGRIADVTLDTQDALTLERMAQRRPDGWSVELVAFSLTGACARCREGPAAPR